MGFKKRASPNHEPQAASHSVGQLYGIDLSKGKWGAAQIVTSKPGCVQLAALDWFGDRCPSVVGLYGHALLVHDHHSWEPATMINRIEDSTLSTEYVPLGRSPMPVELGSSYDQRAAGLGALDALGGLQGFSYDGDDLRLIDYLKTKPLIQEVAWSSNVIEELDLRGTHLTSIGVGRMPKLTRIWLPDCCESLNGEFPGALSVMHRDKDHTGRKANIASKAYRDAVKAIAADTTNVEKVLRTFIDVFNQMDEKDGVDTVDREDIWNAYAEIDDYEELFDDWREF